MSSIASSPAITIIQNDFVDQMLAGGNTENEAVAGAVAGAYFVFLLIALINFIRERLAQHLLLVFFCAGTYSGAECVVTSPEPCLARLPYSPLLVDWRTSCTIFLRSTCSTHLHTDTMAAMGFR